MGPHRLLLPVDGIAQRLKPAQDESPCCRQRGRLAARYHVLDGLLVAFHGLAQRSRFAVDLTLPSPQHRALLLLARPVHDLEQFPASDITTLSVPAWPHPCLAMYDLEQIPGASKTPWQAQSGSSFLLDLCMTWRNSPVRGVRTLSTPDLALALKQLHGSEKSKTLSRPALAFFSLHTAPFMCMCRWKCAACACQCQLRVEVSRPRV